MKSVLNYFKGHLSLIFLLILILGGQVWLELRLPQYTSDIVNIGIQQGGIDKAIPKAIDESTYGMILSMSELKDRTKIAESYEYWSPKINNKKNNSIKINNPNTEFISNKHYDKNYYVLKNDISTENIDGIETALSRSLTSYASYAMSMQKTKGARVLSNVDVKNLPDFMKKQIAIKTTESIYNANGINTDKMQKSYLWRIGTIMLIMALAIGALSIVVSYIAARVSTKVCTKLRSDSYKKVMQFSDYEMNKFTSASLISRTTNDIQQIQQSSVLALKFVFYGPIMAICAFVQISKLNMSMIWIILLAIFATISSIAVIMKFSLPKFKRIQGMIDKLNLVSIEFITGIEVNRVFNASKHEEERFDGVNAELTAINLFVSKMMSFMMPIMMLIMNGATLLIVWFGAKNIDKGQLFVGDMMAFIQYAMMIIMAFLFISMMSVILPRAIISANRIGEILECQIMIEDKGTVDTFDQSGVIEFRNVDFKYEGASKNIVENISFKTQKGKITAIIGSTGAGKSTIVNLIPRFLERTKGQILLNGVDTRDIPMNVLRDKVAIVPQKPVIFSGTIESNIEYGRCGYSKSDLRRASEIAQAMDFVEGKENGFQSKIEQSGSNLSGGQKQRLAIARAIAKDSEIMIFDDSFSALDASTDRKLRSEINSKLRDKAIIIIAQRINTIISADEIIVLEDGKIVGKGKHEDLLSNCKIYYEIAKSQLTEEELSNVK